MICLTECYTSNCIPIKASYFSTISRVKYKFPHVVGALGIQQRPQYFNPCFFQITNMIFLQWETSRYRRLKRRGWGQRRKDQRISTDSTFLLTPQDFPQKSKIFNPKNWEGISAGVLCESVYNVLTGWWFLYIYKSIYVYKNTIISFLC